MGFLVLFLVYRSIRSQIEVIQAYPEWKKYPSKDSQQKISKFNARRQIEPAPKCDSGPCPINLPDIKAIFCNRVSESERIHELILTIRNEITALQCTSMQKTAIVSILSPEYLRRLLYKVGKTKHVQQNVTKIMFVNWILKLSE